MMFSFFFSFCGRHTATDEMWLTIVIVVVDDDVEQQLLNIGFSPFEMKKHLPNTNCDYFYISAWNFRNTQRNQMQANNSHALKQKKKIKKKF